MACFLTNNVFTCLILPCLDYTWYWLSADVWSYVGHIGRFIIGQTSLSLCGRHHGLSEPAYKHLVLMFTRCVCVCVCLSFPQLSRCVSTCSIQTLPFVIGFGAYLEIGQYVDAIFQIWRLTNVSPLYIYIFQLKHPLIMTSH